GPPTGEADARPLEAPPVHPAARIPRLQMPAERIARWIHDSGVKYARVPAEQIERAVGAQDEAAGQRAGETYLREVRISAKLADDDTLVGSAVFDIQHLANTPSFLAL